MCGIAGKIDYSTNPNSSLGDLMGSSLKHRGPDSSGVFSGGPALLLHTRLKIIDLSDAGRQPMSNDDGTIHIVFNGEIYNYLELRRRLTHYTFYSESDTEVLLHLYEEFGRECVYYIRGMFAFAIWNENSEELFLARDRLGQKPLFYRCESDTFWFGSTIRSILADPAVTPSPDHAAIRSYLNYHYVPSPATGFEEISQLEPGEYMLFSKDGCQRHTYWTPSPGRIIDAPPEQLIERVREELKHSVELRMRSDVPVGIFLSGGLDSAIVTALMSDLSEDPVETYSMGFGKAKHDERPFAKLVADRYETNHHTYSIAPDSTDLIPKLVDEYEMPFGDSSALPTYCISEAAADDTRVILNGTGGDELFAGYDRYRTDQLLTRSRVLPRPVYSAGRKMLSPFSDIALLGKAHRLFEIGATADEVEQYANFVAHFQGELYQTVWDGSSSNDELAYLRKQFDATAGPDRLSRLLELDIRTSLPNGLLVKVDRASMAHGLEVRSPFLDHKFVEFVARIPSKYKLRRGSNKWLLKQAFREEVPDPILNREKQGFGLPVNDWFRGELREFARSKLASLGYRDYFNADGLDKLFNRHQKGEREYGIQLWELVMLESWFERFIDCSDR